MAAESNVGARLFLIGKSATIAGLREVQAAVDNLNRQIAAGAGASKVATAGYEEQMAGLEALQARMALYEEQLGTVNAETDAVARVGKVAFLGLTAAAAAWGFESIRWAQNYQTQLVRLRTQAGLTVGAMNAIGRAAMANAAALGTTPTTYLQAAYHPASTGMGVRESIAITNQAAKLAAIGGSPVETTVNALTGVMKSYGMKRASQAPHAAALLNAIIGAGNMRAATLNAALASGVAATAKTFGVSLASMGGALAFMTDRGVPASQAGTHLRMTLSLLGAPSAKADQILTAAGLTTAKAKATTNAMSQMLRTAGVTVTQLSAALRTNKGRGGIYHALALLHRHLAGAGLSPEMQSATISRAFGGGRMGSTVEMMYNQVTQLGRKSTQIGRNATRSRFNKDWIAETHTLDFQLHKLGATIETLGTQFGQKLIPPLTKAVEMFTSMLKWIDKNKEVAIGLATAVGAILVPAIGVYLYRALLSSGGAIRTVIAGYGNLLRGNNAEQLALQRTNALLQDATFNTDALASADTQLATNSSRAASALGLEDEAAMGGGGVGVGGIGMAGKAMRVGMGLGAAYVVGAAVRGKAGTTLTGTERGMTAVRTVLGDMGEGAVAGGTIGSIIPGVGTVVGAGVGGAVGGLYAERHQIASTAHHVWDDLFGGGSSAPTHRVAIHNHVHVSIDGKQVTASVQRRTKSLARRSS